MNKIRVRDLTAKDLKELKAHNIAKAKSFYENMPFVTPLYLSIKLKMPIQFILDNKKEIGFA